MSLFQGSGPSPEEIARERLIKQSLTTNLNKAVKQLQKEHVQSEEPIFSEDSANSVCNVIEAIFLHGLKPSVSKKLSGLLGSIQDPSAVEFWDFLTRFSHHDVVSQLNHLAMITTKIGMCRAWVRLALNDCLLESYLTSMSRDVKTLQAFYGRTAYLRDPEHPTMMMTYIQGLSAFTFKLSINSSVLNIWTPTPLSLAGLAVVQTYSPARVLSPVPAEEALPGSIVPESSKIQPLAPNIPQINNPSSSQAVPGSENRDSNVLLGAFAAVPPNTPYDPSTFAPSEIDHIRRLLEQKYTEKDEDATSTATSQVSVPDDTDQRVFPQQNISPRRALILGQGVTERSGHESFDNDNLVIRGAVRKKMRNKLREKDDNRDKRSSTSSTDRRKGTSVKSDSSTAEANTNNTKQQNEGSAKNRNNDNDSHMSSNNGLVGENIAKKGFLDSNDSRTIPTSDSMACQPVVTSSVNDVDKHGANSTKPNETITVDKIVSTGALTESASITNNNKHDHVIGHSIYSDEYIPPVKTKTIIVAKPQETTQNVGVEASSSTWNSPSLSTSPGRFSVGKSAAPPQLSSVTATAIGINRGMEVDRDSQHGYLEELEDDEIRIFDHQFATSPPSSGHQFPTTKMADSPRPPATMPRGNSLGIVETWSSDITEDITEALRAGSHDNQGDQYVAGNREHLQVLGGGLISGASSLLTGTLGGLISYFGEGTSWQERSSAAQSGSTLSSGGLQMYDGFEIVTENDRDIDMVEREELFREQLTEIQHERGLDFQNFQCLACKRQVGLFFCSPRVCCFGGGYYCYECHENQERYIPARIIHNWDFQKYPVSRVNAVMLHQYEDTPLLNINKINPRLYDHVQEMSDIKTLRLQLRFLKAYLFTCKESVADDFRRQVSPKEYLCDDVHLYSLADLLAVASGQLAASLQRVIQWASQHVYSCGLCSGKGFICEICNLNKVIYPFQIASTSRCETCDAVYHKTCKEGGAGKAGVPCPKCQRRLQRQRALGLTETAVSGGPADQIDMDYDYGVAS